MISKLNNIYKFDLQFYKHQLNSQYNSLFYSILYLTTHKFKSSSTNTQQVLIKKYIKDLQNSIKRTINKEINPLFSILQSSNNLNIMNSIGDESSPTLENDTKFIIEHLMSYRILIFEEDSFYPFTPNSSLEYVLIYKNNIL